MQKDKIKVYVVMGGKNNASWLDCEIVENMEDADLVLFTGGADINPSLYKQNKGKFTHCNSERDTFEFSEARHAELLGKPMFGICRGAQLACVYNGGQLVQHMNHPATHNLTLYDGVVFKTNSVHHQLQKPFNLHPSKYKILAYSKGLSNVYLDGNNNETMLPSVGKAVDSYYKEPELVYYKDTNWLGIQGHPEWMPYNSDMCIILRSMVNLLIDNKLDMVASLSIPSNRYVNKELIISETEEKQYQLILENIKKAEVN